MEGIKFPICLACPPPVAEAIPTPVASGSISPPHSVISAAAPSMTADEAATRQKKRKAKKQKGQVEVPVAQSPSLGPPVIPEPKLGSPRLLAPETLSSEVDPAVRGKKREENQATAAAPLLEPVEEAGGKEEKKKRERRKHGEEAASPSQSAVAGAPIFVGEDKTANVVAPAPEQGKRKRRRVKEQEQSSQSPLPFDVHPQGLKEAAEGPKCENVAVRSSSKKPCMPSNREIIRMRIEATKQQPLPEGLLDAMRKAANPSTNSTDKNSNHASPFGAFFDQFCYKSDRRQKHEENQATAAASLLEPVEEVGGKEEKKRKRRKHREEAASPSQSAVAGAPIFEGEDKTANVVAPALEHGKRKRRWVKEQEQLSQSPLPFDVHLQGLKEAAEGPKCENVTVRSSSKKHCMPSNREIIRMRIEARKQQPLPEGLLDAMRKAANPTTNSTEQNSNHASPFGAFFDQFCYKSDRRQNRNSPSFPKTPDRPARSPPRGCVSSGPSQLAGNGTSKAAKTPISNASVSLSQEAVQAKDNEKPEKKMNGKKKQRKPKPLLITAEKWSDKYRRMPLDQLVPPPRSPYKLLQEKYASDPWKVIVICMLLNLTQGKQVRKKVKGFFKRYPDPQTACRADRAEMTEYLTPLGLQQVKTDRIQRFSKDYVEKEWTYITELCGVGKYAADAYAIFCAGRATEVVPEDHKLVDYWKYVCFELPLIQGSENAQEPGMTDQLEKVVPKVQELAVCR